VKESVKSPHALHSMAMLETDEGDRGYGQAGTPPLMHRLSDSIGVATSAMREVEGFLREQHHEIARARMELERERAELERARADLQCQRTELSRQRAVWLAEAEVCRDQRARAEDRVVLLVGGVQFETTRKTLCAYPGSMLEAMFSGRHRLACDNQGRVIIDRDPRLFKHILRYLRDVSVGLASPPRALDGSEEVPDDLRQALSAEFDYFLLMPPRAEGLSLPSSSPSPLRLSSSSLLPAEEVLPREVIARLSDVTTLRIHTGAVVCLRIHGDLLASSGVDGAVRLFDLTRGVYVRDLVGHTGPLWCLQFQCKNGRLKLFSGSSDRTIRAWDCEAGICEKVFVGHTDTVRWIEPIADGSGLWSASSDKTVALWGADGLRRHSFVAHERALVFLQQARCTVRKPGVEPRVCDLVVTAGFDDNIKVWDVSRLLTLLSATATAAEESRSTMTAQPQPELVHTLTGHTGAVVALQVFSGSRLASSSYDHTARVWDLETGLCLRIFNGHTDIIRTLHVVRGELLLTGGQDGSIRVWDIAQGTCLRVLTGHIGLIWAVTAWRSSIVSAGADRCIKIWSPLPNPIS